MHAISVATCFIVFILKCVAPIRALIDLNGCSTVLLRNGISPGSSFAGRLARVDGRDGVITAGCRAGLNQDGCRRANTCRSCRSNRLL